MLIPRGSCWCALRRGARGIASAADAAWTRPTPYVNDDGTSLTRALREEKRENRERSHGRESLDARVARVRSGLQGTDGCVDAQADLVRTVTKLGRERRWQDALAVIADVQVPGGRLQNAVLDACARSSQEQVALTMFEGMPEKSASAYNIMICLYGRLGQRRKIDNIRQRMKEEGTEFTQVTWGSLVAAYGSARDLDSMYRTLREMREVKARICEVTYGSAIASCARLGDRWRVEELMAEMRTEKLEPNLGHFTSLLGALARNKEESRARETWADMRRLGIEPDTVAYTVFLGCFAGESALTKAEAVLAEMESASVQRDVFVYNSVAKVAIEASQPEKARFYLDELERSGLVPNRETDVVRKRLQSLEGDIAASKQATTSSPSTPSPPSPPLPTGWRQTMDPARGLPYYWREDNPAETVTWQRPV